MSTPNTSKTNDSVFTAAIVGGGNSAHILANLFTRCHINTIVLTRRPKAWNTGGITMRCKNERIAYQGHPFVASADFSLIAKANVVILCCPVHVEIELLTKMAPFLPSKTLVGTVFGQCRFDKMVKYATKNQQQPCFAFIQIPWICRVITYGQEVDNLGDQSTHLALHCIKPNDPALMQWLQCIHAYAHAQIQTVSFNSEWFFPSNLVIHPAICFGRNLIKCKSHYFYKNISPISGACIEQLDVERLNVVRALNERYQLGIDDASINDFWRVLWNSREPNMYEKIKHEASLENITVPVDIHQQSQHRFFRDDIPFGLCYLKFIAELLGVDTPFTDTVIRWAQNVMHIDFLDKHDKLIVRSLPDFYVNDDDPLCSKL